MNFRTLMLLSVFVLLAGCNSEERKAYDYAKEEGKSDFYAKAYAEQIAEGKAKVYAEAYAFLLETSQEGIGFRQYDDKMKKVSARIYAEKIYEGENFIYATIYAKHYCRMLPVAKEFGRDERFVHQYTRHYVKMEPAAKKLLPHHSSEYIKHFSHMYASEMALGATNEQAVKKAMKYAYSKPK